VQPFEPGQFLHLALDVGGEQVHRPYSVASPHGDILDFFIVTVPEGQLSPRLEALQVGDQVEVSEKAAGGFILDKAAPLDDLWLFATGTGLAPYIAMLRTEMPWQRFRKIVLIHGVRNASDLAYLEEIRKWKNDFGEQFQYLGCLSRDQAEGCLSGRTTDLLDDGCLEAAVGLTIAAQASVVMICGNPAMLEQLEAILIDRSLVKARHSKPGNLISERYW